MKMPVMGPAPDTSQSEFGMTNPPEGWEPRWKSPRRCHHRFRAGWPDCQRRTSQASWTRPQAVAPPAEGWPATVRSLCPEMGPPAAACSQITERPRSLPTTWVHNGTPGSHRIRQKSTRQRTGRSIPGSIQLLPSGTVQVVARGLLIAISKSLGSITIRQHQVSDADT
jgi:hypothetical protein